MSKEEFSNRTTVKATHKDSSRSGELMQQKRITIRGKGNKESRKESFDAIFTFNEPLFCELSEIPLGGGYFLTEEGKAEVTQLIGRFDSETELNAWVNQTLEVNNDTST